MKNQKNITLSFLEQQLSNQNGKLLKALINNQLLEIFHEKCCNFISNELKIHIKKMATQNNLSDGAQNNYFEELKIKLMLQAISQFEPAYLKLESK